MSDPVASVELLRNRYLSPLDEHFARAMGRIGGEDRPEVGAGRATRSPRRFPAPT